MFKNRIDTSGYKEGGVMGGETIDYPGRETVLKHQQELRETARRERSEGLSEGRTEQEEKGLKDCPREEPRNV